MKAFPKTPEKIVTVTIDEDGQMTYLATDSADIFMECGQTITRRASHVEPATFWPRVAFHILRRFVTDKGRIAAWTRTWTCDWRINTSPVGGPILTWRDVWRTSGGIAGDEHNWPDTEVATFRSRKIAIDSEILFLDTYFATRGEKIR